MFPDSLESLLLTDLTSPPDDLAVDSTNNNGLDNGGVVDVCAEFGECDHIYEFPSIVEEEAGWQFNWLKFSLE